MSHSSNPNGTLGKQKRVAVVQLAYSTSAQMHLTGYCSRNVALDRPLGDKENTDEIIEWR